MNDRASSGAAAGHGCPRNPPAGPERSRGRCRLHPFYSEVPKLVCRATEAVTCFKGDRTVPGLRRDGWGGGKGGGGGRSRVGKVVVGVQPEL